MEPALSVADRRLVRSRAPQPLSGISSGPHSEFSDLPALAGGISLFSQLSPEGDPGTPANTGNSPELFADRVFIVSILLAGFHLPGFCHARSVGQSLHLSRGGLVT